MAKTIHKTFSAEVATSQKRAKKYEYLEARIALPELEDWQIIPVWGSSEVMLTQDGTLVVRMRREVTSES